MLPLLPCKAKLPLILIYCATAFANAQALDTSDAAKSMALKEVSYSAARNRLLQVQSAIELNTKRCYVADTAGYVLELHYAERNSNSVKERGCWNYDVGSGIVYIRWEKIDTSPLVEVKGLPILHTDRIEVLALPQKLKFKPDVKLTSINN